MTAVMLSELYPSKWLKAVDLNGADMCVGIHGLGKKEVGQDQEERVVIEWIDKDVKPMILNKENATTIGKLYGEDTSKWRAREVLLYETTVSAFGKTHNVIRVRDTVPDPAPVAA